MFPITRGWYCMYSRENLSPLWQRSLSDSIPLQAWIRIFLKYICALFSCDYVLIIVSGFSWGLNYRVAAKRFRISRNCLFSVGTQPIHFHNMPAASLKIRTNCPPLMYTYEILYLCKQYIHLKVWLCWLVYFWFKMLPVCEHNFGVWVLLFTFQFISCFLVAFKGWFCLTVVLLIVLML